MDVDDTSDLSSLANTSQLDIPTTLQRTDDYRSLHNEPSKTPLPTYNNIEDIDWSRLKGYQLPLDDINTVSGVYNHGWRLLQAQTSDSYWLCKRCHKARRVTPAGKQLLFKVTTSTSSAIKHLKKLHYIDQKGTDVTKKRPLFEDWSSKGSSEPTAVANHFAANFDQATFKSLLYRYVINNNVAFSQLESDDLRQLLIYLQPRCEPSIPSRWTASRTIDQIHDRSIGLVTEQLATAVTSINFSFDLWTSGNKLAMLGICAHFISSSGQPITTLLALPRQTGRHTGIRIADTVGDIIAAYGLNNDQIGYFTTDNASSNASCMDQLAKDYCFNRDQRWIRCCGHIFNLVGQAALFGSDHVVFSQSVDQMELEEALLQQWRRKGPIGRLHNLIHWINRSPQRCERFCSFQKQLVAPTRPDGKQEVYQLVTDVTTRWNSFFEAAKRATYLQPAIDAVLEEEQAEFDRQVAQAKRSSRSNLKLPQRPPILDDALTVTDWQVINQYLAILKPLKDATVKLEGHIGGRFGSIWQVLPVFEELLHHFERLASEYPIKSTLRAMDIHLQPPLGFSQQPEEPVESQLTSQPSEQTTDEDHFSINIDLAWSKLNQYYARLDNSPVYVTAIVLHPCFKWRWLEKRWSHKPEWLTAARGSFGELVNQYRLERGSYSPEAKRQKPSAVDESDSEDDELLDIDQQLSDYKRDFSYKHLQLTRDSSPIGYWISKQFTWPALARLALDVYAIPVMSDEPERVFSITGAAVTPRRRSLKDQTINHLMTVKAWSKAGLVSLDRSYFAPPLANQSPQTISTEPIVIK